MANGYKQNKTITIYAEKDLELYIKALDDLKIEYIKTKSNTFLAIADITIFYELGDIKRLNDKLKELYKGV